MKKRWFVTVALATVLIVALVAVWVVNRPKNVSDSTQTTGALHATGLLLIKEWGVELPLSSTITDAYYTYDASSKEVFISTKQLDTLLSHVQGCSSGLHGLYYKKTVANPLSLAEQRRIEPMCAIPANGETAQIGTIQADIRTAAQAASTY